jgi:hypothetical protein
LKEKVYRRRSIQKIKKKLSLNRAFSDLQKDSNIKGTIKRNIKRTCSLACNDNFGGGIHNGAYAKQKRKSKQKMDYKLLHEVKQVENDNNDNDDDDDDDDADDEDDTTNVINNCKKRSSDPITSIMNQLSSMFHRRATTKPTTDSKESSSVSQPSTPVRNVSFVIQNSMNDFITNYLTPSNMFSRTNNRNSLFDNARNELSSAKKGCENNNDDDDDSNKRKEKFDKT